MLWKVKPLKSLEAIQISIYTNWLSLSRPEWNQNEYASHTRLFTLKSRRESKEKHKVCFKTIIRVIKFFLDYLTVLTTRRKSVTRFMVRDSAVLIISAPNAIGHRQLTVYKLTVFSFFSFQVKVKPKAMESEATLGEGGKGPFEDNRMSRRKWKRLTFSVKYGRSQISYFFLFSLYNSQCTIWSISRSNRHQK